MTSRNPSRKRGAATSAGRSSKASAQWEVVVVPFPFSTHPGNKRRPALVLSARSFNQSGNTILAMITTASHRPWPGDVVLNDLDSAGLHSSCLVRLKLFTIDNRLILKRIGRLSSTDQQNVELQLQTCLPW